MGCQDYAHCRWCSRRGCGTCRPLTACSVCATLVTIWGIIWQEQPALLPLTKSTKQPTFSLADHLQYNRPLLPFHIPKQFTAVLRTIHLCFANSGLIADPAHKIAVPTMSYYNQGYQPSTTPQNAQNLNFYQSNYGPGVSGHTTPSQASYGSYPGASTTNAYPAYGSGTAAGFGAPGVSGRMGEQGGLRTGWIAAFSTEGYEGEPGLMEELGVNFGHIKTKVSQRHHIS